MFKLLAKTFGNSGATATHPGQSFDGSAEANLGQTAAVDRCSQDDPKANLTEFRLIALEKSGRTAQFNETLSSHQSEVWAQSIVARQQIF